MCIIVWIESLESSLTLRTDLPQFNTDSVVRLGETLELRDLWNVSNLCLYQIQTSKIYGGILWCLVLASWRGRCEISSIISSWQNVFLCWSRPKQIGDKNL